eukprot:TRINITY_DN50180_c0_g1_i1.p1 TRINITY_DN50180_c0_g1~~TRINITY_DN50180_c0_g1_i1.p1  ORF type:complete len:613 (-),score=134.24 TRINITY_DN50180_c0_g1_i1:85-1923(-)
MKLKAGQKLVSNQRVQGTLSQWKGSFGWVEPLQTVKHPLAKQNGGRIYVHRSDIRKSAFLPPVGSQVDFLLYSDAQGLGASDLIPIEKVKAETSIASQAKDRPLPAGWKKVWSEEHNQHYFWNSETKESSWTRPDLTEEEAQQAQNADAEQNEDEEKPLPEGWTRVWDPERDHWYYWHKATRTASWERPAEEEEGRNEGQDQEQEEDGDDDEYDEGDEEMDDSGDADVLAQQRVNGKIVDWSGISGWIRPQKDLSGDLHPLLHNSEDRIYVNWRDVQKSLHPEVGALVDFLVYADDNGLGAKDVRPQGELQDLAKTRQQQPRNGGKRRRRGSANSDPLAQLEKQWAKQDANLGVKPGVVKMEQEAFEWPSKEEVEGPLLPGWVEKWSKVHESAYYWHEPTGQSTWDRPSMPINVDDEDDGGNANNTASKAPVSRTTDKATPLTPLTAEPGRAMTPLTPGEVEALTGQVKILPTRDASASTGAAAAHRAEAARVLQARSATSNETGSTNGHPPVSGAAAVGARPTLPRPSGPRPSGQNMNSQPQAWVQQRPPSYYQPVGAGRPPLPPRPPMPRIVPYPQAPNLLALGGYPGGPPSYGRPTPFAHPAAKRPRYF